MGSGQSSSSKVTKQDKAILDLKLQRDKLKQYQKRIESVLESEKQAAQDALARGNKNRALLALRRRKYQQSLLVQTDNQLATLQELVQSIEFSLVEKDVLFGLRQGTDVLKELNREVNVESVEKLMGETADAIAYQREVDEMLQSKMSVEDEEAVQAELAAMEAERLGETIPILPNAPTKEPTQQVPELEEPTVSTPAHEREQRIALPA